MILSERSFTIPSLFGMRISGFIRTHFYSVIYLRRIDTSSGIIIVVPSVIPVVINTPIIPDIITIPIILISIVIIP